MSEIAKCFQRFLSEITKCFRQFLPEIAKCWQHSNLSYAADKPKQPTQDHRHN